MRDTSAGLEAAVLVHAARQGDVPAASSSPRRASCRLGDEREILRSRTTRRSNWGDLRRVRAACAPGADSRPYLAQDGGCGPANSAAWWCRAWRQGRRIMRLTYFYCRGRSISAQKLSWLSLKPGHRCGPHQLAWSHTADYRPSDHRRRQCIFTSRTWLFPGGIQNRLHLLARRTSSRIPRTGRPLDVSAPLAARTCSRPPHLLALDTERL